MGFTPLPEVLLPVWSLLALALSAAHPPQSKIAVMDVVLKAGAPADAGQILSEAIVAEVRKRRPKASVVSAEEIRAMIQVQGEKQKLGCQADKDLACLAEIGGALGVERVVVGSLGRLGKTYVYSLKLIDVGRATVLRSGSVNLQTKEDDELLAATTKLVGDLFPEAAVVAEPRETQPPIIETPETLAAQKTAARPASHSHLTSILLGVGGLACGGVAIYGLTRVLAYNSDVSTINHRTPGQISSSQLQSDRSSAQVWQPLSIGLAVLGAAGLTGAALTW